MRKKAYIEGFYERLDEACKKSGLPKTEIARRCGFDRRSLSLTRDNQSMTSGYVAKFCAVTHTDANWLLGLTRERG